MTYYYYSEKILSQQDAFFNFKEILKQAGWVITSSGTGTSGTYNATGDNILTSANLGARAWYVAAHPVVDGYQRYLCFQMGTSVTDGSARIKIAWSPYSAGSPNANTVPGSADEQILLGSGTDASPSTTNLITATTSLNNIFASCGDINEKFSFYFISYPNVTAMSSDTVNGFFLMQYLTNTHALDIDPYVYHALGNSPTFNTSTNAFGSNGSSPMKGWYKKGLSGAAFTTYPVVFYGGDGASHMLADMGSNPFDGSVPIFPVLVGRSNTTNNGVKGIMRDMSISLTPRGSLSTLSVNSIRDKIFMGKNFIFNHSGNKVNI